MYIAPVAGFTEMHNHWDVCRLPPIWCGSYPPQVEEGDLGLTRSDPSPHHQRLETLFIEIMLWNEEYFEAVKRELPKYWEISLDHEPSYNMQGPGLLALQLYFTSA